jgi:hypothetical protein
LYHIKAAFARTRVLTISSIKSEESKVARWRRLAPTDLGEELHDESYAAALSPWKNRWTPFYYRKESVLLGHVP